MYFICTEWSTVATKISKNEKYAFKVPQKLTSYCGSSMEMRNGGGGWVK